MIRSLCEEAWSRRLSVSAMSGKELETFIAEIMRDVSPPLITKLKEAIAPYPPDHPI